MAGTMFLQHWLVFVALLRLLSGLPHTMIISVTQQVRVSPIHRSVPRLFQLYQVSGLPL